MLLVTGRLKLSIEPSIVGPASVLANRYRYFPLRSNTGEKESLIPSVTRWLSPVSSEYRNTERMWLNSCCVYASHLLSGDHAAREENSDSAKRSRNTFTGFFFSRSTYQRFRRLSA